MNYKKLATISFTLSKSCLIYTLIVGGFFKSLFLLGMHINLINLPIAVLLQFAEIILPSSLIALPLIAYKFKGISKLSFSVLMPILSLGWVILLAQFTHTLPGLDGMILILFSFIPARISYNRIKPILNVEVQPQ